MVKGGVRMNFEKTMIWEKIMDADKYEEEV